MEASGILCRLQIFWDQGSKIIIQIFIYNILCLFCFLVYDFQKLNFDICIIRSYVLRLRFVQVNVSGIIHEPIGCPEAVVVERYANQLIGIYFVLQVSRFCYRLVMNYFVF